MQASPIEGRAKTYLVSKARTYGRDDYAKDIRAAVRGVWSGVLDELQFLEAMYSTVSIGLTAAWREGAQACGIAPGDLTLDEEWELHLRITEQMTYLSPFLQDIQTSSKANRGKLTPFLQRAQMWVNRYDDIKNQARQIACKDQKLEWIFGDTVHCVDCQKLNGRVYRASIWRKYNIRPQMFELACHGFKCRCHFEPTTKPVTPGMPPSLVGA